LGWFEIRVKSRWDKTTSSSLSKPPGSGDLMATDAEQPVQIQLHDITLAGDLMVPPRARGIVIFAHGSGSSRRSSRNRHVAGVLQQAGLATLLFDLLSEAEERAESLTRHLRFDIELLADRLAVSTTWLSSHAAVAHLPIGYFGASTGGGAAIVAATRLPGRVCAVVSRGGRPDLAADALPRIAVPTLLIVGGDDDVVIELNREALGHMQPGVGTLEIVPGATHLFEEPGTLEQVATLARDWFTRHLPKAAKDPDTGTSAA
jgi:putative phosphoribosyl transferase